jgi:hypothetical protein
MSTLPRAMSPAGLGQRISPKERLADGTLADLDNLAVAAPPRHGKTRILTELFSAWFLGTNPASQVIVASHSARLASKFGMHVRDILDEFGRAIFGVEVRRTGGPWTTGR